MLTLRKGRYEDKEAIKEISKTIWEGNDYLPNIFDKWVDDKEGEFTIVEIDGVVKGCAKFTVLSPGEYWLEGIRVASDTRGQGIGKKVTEYYIQKAKEMDFDTLSLSSYINNHESRKIVEANGFKITTGFKALYIEEKIELGEIKEYEKVTSIEDIKYIFDTKEMKDRSGFLAFDWTFVKGKEELIKSFIKEGSVYSLKIDGEVKSTIILSSRYGKANGLFIAYLDGEEYYEDAFKFAIKKYNESNYDSLEFMCPSTPKMKETAFRLGLQAWDDYEENVFVFEYIEK